MSKEAVVVPELKYAAISAVLLVLTATVIPGGRVLVLPEIFLIMLLLLYWAAKPKTKE